MTRVLRGLLVLALLIGFAGLTNGRLNEILPPELTSGMSAPSIAAAPPLVLAADQDVTAAIQQVIQHSNDEQVQAIAARNPALMVDSVTSDHYQELVQVNQDLLDNGVTSISLVRLEWGAIAVDGSTATATTYETWGTVYADGTSTRSRDRNDYTLVLDNGSWKIKADAHPGQSPAVASPPPSSQPIPGNPNQNTSHNWSGYAASGGSYTAVGGTWTVPQFNGSTTSFGIDAAWVGIGGVHTTDLIQAGTQETVNGNGRSQYEAWVEMLPAASRPVPLRVHPGDSISVAITEQTTNTWLIDFTNNTTGQNYQETQHYRSSHSSAEWVEEAPSAGRGSVLPLADFGKIDFTNGAATKDGTTVSVADSGAQPITMLGANNEALAVPSSLGSDGGSFTVARTNAPATTAPFRGRGFSIPIPLDNGGS